MPWLYDAMRNRRTEPWPTWKGLRTITKRCDKRNEAIISEAATGERKVNCSVVLLCASQDWKTTTQRPCKSTPPYETESKPRQISTYERLNTLTFETLYKISATWSPKNKRLRNLPRSTWCGRKIIQNRVSCSFITIYHSKTESPTLNQDLELKMLAKYIPDIVRASRQDATAEESAEGSYLRRK